MKTRALPIIVFSLALAASAQDPGSAPPASPSNSNGAGSYGQRGSRGFGGGMGIGGGRGLIGTVTEVAADHYTVKSDTGEIYTVHFSVNTRIMKQGVGQRDSGQGKGGGRDAGASAGGGEGMGRGGNPPEPIKPTDIRVGDAVGVMGEVDLAAKSVGAVAILQLDPERAKQMQLMQANYGKTWILGKVTAIDDAKVILIGSIDNAPHAFVADENTTFRKRRDPITLADIQVGDIVRADGALKGGIFTATTVNVMGMPPAGTPNVPRNAPPQ